MRKKFITIFALLTLTSCSGIQSDGQDYPKTHDQVEAERVGKLTGEEGIVLFGGKKKSSGTDGINVNSYLWRAALDTIYFMPLVSADPFGGTVLTDWYKGSNNARERYKLNIFIIGAEFRSDAIRVSVFKQKLDNRSNWVDVEVGAEMGQEIENKILLRAREIKYGSAH